MKLYDLPRDKGVKLYGWIYQFKARPIIFGHLDGMYSYCWFEGTDEIVHLKANTSISEYKDGYVIDGTDIKELELLSGKD